MEINGEVNIEIDQYADVNFDIDTEQLAEILCQDHNLVDDVVLHAYVEEQIDERMADYELRVQVDDLELSVDELREQIRQSDTDKDNSTGLTPEEFHILVADIAKEIARGEICVALADAHEKMQARLNGEA